MVLDDLVAERRQVVRGYRAEPKRQKTPYPKLMVAVATGVTLGLYLGLASNTMPSPIADQTSVTHVSAR
jgi:hypothetical protein